LNIASPNLIIPTHFLLLAPHPLPPTLAPSLSHQTELDAHLDTLTDKAECGEAWTKFSDDIVSEDFDKLSLEEKTKVKQRRSQTLGGRVARRVGHELNFL
jgi:hypothetical protein